tara:strand:+ start:1074 stop:1325 length:252 start_codon:yes stop_codon:yes gene_type:complete
LYYVYLIISKKNEIVRTYVGYTNNLNQRLKKHNSNKGAKSTKGRFWKIAYKKRKKYKITALKYEYYLKNNKKLRKKIKDSYVW